MADAARVREVFSSIARAMDENCDYLVELDQQNGDGDLGISMKSGFAAVESALAADPQDDLGRLFMKAASTLNQEAPSSLGTILSIGMMGMAKDLRGQTEADAARMADALQAGLDKIMEKTGSSLGEKTVLDALAPGVEALRTGDLDAAAKAAAAGSEATRDMLAKHGRAAYYGEKSRGILDGGSVVGRLIFEAIAAR